MLESIQRIFVGSRETYGSPRIYRELKKQGLAVSRRRVERLMREAGLRARVARIYRSNPRLHRFYDKYPNRLWKHQAKRPGEIWVADVTYLPVQGKWYYLAVVMDQCSRRILGWSLKSKRGTAITRTALDLATRAQQPKPGLIFHSDRGSEYASTVLGDRFRALGMLQSMTRGGCPADNPHAESFFHSLKADVIHAARFDTEAQLRSCVRSYIRFYNHRRSHSSLGFVSPIEYEIRVA